MPDHKECLFFSHELRQEQQYDITSVHQTGSNKRYTNHTIEPATIATNCNTLLALTLFYVLYVVVLVDAACWL